MHKDEWNKCVSRSLLSNVVQALTLGSAEDRIELMDNGVAHHSDKPDFYTNIIMDDDIDPAALEDYKSLQKKRGIQRRKIEQLLRATLVLSIIAVSIVTVLFSFVNMSIILTVLCTCGVVSIVVTSVFLLVTSSNKLQLVMDIVCGCLVWAATGQLLAAHYYLATACLLWAAVGFVQLLCRCSRRYCPSKSNDDPTNALLPDNSPLPQAPSISIIST